MKKPIPKEIVDKYSYDPNTGVFINLSNGKVCRSKERYLKLYFKGESYVAHRVAFVCMGMEVPNLVDHINGIKRDNRWINLRAANDSINVLNHNNKQRKSKSGHRGVYYHGGTYRKNPWHAYAHLNRKYVHIGSFSTPEEAAEARKKWTDTHIEKQKV